MTPTILVTNDDGVRAPGLERLARALRAVGQVWVVAPDRERNAASHALTLHKPLRVETPAPHVMACSGTPADCVNLAVNALLKHRPALIVSGINRGANLGPDVTYSGTVAAAIEGTLLGIPSVAVSLVDDGEPLDYTQAAAFAARLARVVLARGLPAGVLLNVNAPPSPQASPPRRAGKGRRSASILPARITTLGQRIFDRETTITKQDPRGRSYYWIGENRIGWREQKDADYFAVDEGVISVTPLHLDLTHYATLEQFRAWEPLFGSRAARRPVAKYSDVTTVRRHHVNHGRA